MPQDESIFAAAVKPSKTLDQAVDNLLRFYTHPLADPTPKTVTYGYRASAPGAAADNNEFGFLSSSFEKFSSNQINWMESAIDRWEEVANITFKRQFGANGNAYTNTASNLFQNYTDAKTDSGGFFQNGVLGLNHDTSGDHQGISDITTPSVGGTSYEITYMHEIGHIVGLPHPSDYDSSNPEPINYTDDASYREDDRLYTIMSYWGPGEVGANWSVTSGTPMLHDIAAAQRLYGANMKTRTGDTVYGFGSNTGLTAFTINNATQDRVFAIWDADGIDTINMSGYKDRQTIDLRSEYYSSTGGQKYNVVIARGATIENAIGGSSSDIMIGNGVSNSLDGRDGNDTLNGGAGMDTLRGGTGNDVYNLFDVTSGAYDRVIEAADGGTDNILIRDRHTGLRSYTLAANVENGELQGTDASAFTLRGNELKNKLYDGNGSNWLYGEGGNDTLSGGGGNDTLDGGSGDDKMFGGDGNDLYWVRNAGDKVFEDPGKGTRDFVNATINSYTLSDNVEFLTYQGTPTLGFTGKGNSLNNSILGWNGEDVLDGMGGADTLVGKAGSDTYYVDNIGDVIIDSSGAKDRVNSRLTSYTLGAGIEELNYVGSNSSANFSGTGNELNNLIIGWAGNDTLNGKGGNDTLRGLSGDDTYFVDSLGDVVIDTAGAHDKINVALTSYTLGAGIEILNYFGASSTAAFTGNGNELDNQIIGWAGNDTLDGKAGHDTLVGLSGSDVYNLFDVSGGAYDEVVEGSGNGNDIVLVRDTHGAVREYTMTSNVERGAIVGADASAFALHGNSLSNELFDDIGDNILYGEGGDDTLDGGNGQDFLFGGAGNDLYKLNDRGSGGAYDLISEDVNAGLRDIVRVNPIHIDGITDSYIMPANIEIGELLGTIAFNLFGNSGNNTLFGNSGNNKLYGNSGNDKLDGGNGYDELNGGTGDDTYYLEDLAIAPPPQPGLSIPFPYDAVVEAADAGIDTVVVTALRNLNFPVDWYVLGNNVENVIVEGSLPFTVAGNTLNNTLTGNAAANVFDAGSGNDTLNGGAGSDALTGGADKDAFVFSTALGPSNIDSISDFNVLDDTIVLDDDIFVNIGAVGVLSGAAFFAGTSASDNSDRIIYDAATGKLYFDADGFGGQLQTQFATIGKNLALTADDFQIVA